MKKLLILLFSILISFNSYGEWTEITSNTKGNTYFINYDSINKHNGLVYYWEMGNNLLPTEGGTLSSQVYTVVECGINRYKHLSFTHFKQSMGNGENYTSSPSNPKWQYQSPDSVKAFVLEIVCDYAE